MRTIPDSSKTRHALICFS